MSTSELYHMQGIVGFTQVGGVRYNLREVHYSVAPQAKMIKCSCCGSPDVVRRGSVHRTLQGVPVGMKKYIYIHVDVPRVECRRCGTIRQIDLGFAEPKKRYTKSFAKEAVLLVTCMSIDAAAARLRVCWHTVNDILQNYIKKKYSRARLKGVRRIGIDETYIGRSKKFITVVLDLDTGDPIFVGEGKGEDALEPFWKLLGGQKKNIEAVAIDLGAAYQKAARNQIPNAVMVFDHFHVVKLLNDRIDQLRRRVFHHAPRWQKDVLRGCRYLILKNRENLDDSRDEKARLKRVLALNTPLTTAYILKESLKLIWKQDSFEEGRACLEDWIAQADASVVQELIAMAKTLKKYSEGILNFYRHPINTAKLEGLNTKIKAMIRRAYGFRNLENFKRLILAIREFNPVRLLADGTG
jgi:transposase